MIKLLALDLDGTTLDSSGAIPASHRLAIRRAEDAGVLVTIATGRRFRDARPVALDLELNAPLITHNGALLKYAGSGETAAYSTIPLETCLKIIETGKKLGGQPLVSTDPEGDGLLLFGRSAEDTPAVRSHLRWSDSLHGDEGRSRVRCVSDIESAIADVEVIHISFSGACEAMREMAALLERELPGLIKVLATIYPKRDFTLLDILPPDASKGHGLAKLAEINRLTPANVMAIGDNFNDLDMLAYAGTAVVMGNAEPRLLDHGEFYTTLSNDNGGVASAIERFILNQENS